MQRGYVHWQYASHFLMISCAKRKFLLQTMMVEKLDTNTWNMWEKFQEL